eukprot:COSAG01_NODE_1009_length_12151_cov_18.810571_9_plen_123_part_00
MSDLAARSHSRRIAHRLVGGEVAPPRSGPTARLHGGLWLVADHGARMQQGGFRHAGNTDCSASSTDSPTCRKSCSGTCCYGTAAHVTLKERSDLKAHETRWTHSSYQINRRDSGNNMLLTFE